MRCAGIVILGPSMANVKGVVTWKGKPVSAASITFSPVPKNADDKEPGKPATGFTDDQGVYQLSTYRNYDGAHVGSHKVQIAVDETNPARCKRLTETTLEVKPGSNEFNIALEDK
jgi:hypothetical protein